MKLRRFRVRPKVVQLWRHHCSRLQSHPSSPYPHLKLTRKLFEWARSLARCLHPQPPHERFHHLREEEPLMAPKGHLAVYVGEEAVDRFIVPVAYCNHPLFRDLLQQAEKQSGFHHPGAITLPCPVSHFQTVRRRIASRRS